MAELNANLDALGYAHGLTGDAFTATTAAAIRRLQAAHGEPQTGELLLGSVTFEPGPIRVTSVMPTVAVGSAVTAGPVLSASWVTRQVSIQLDAGLEGQVKVGDPVTITLPDNQTTPGRISYVSSVASTGQNGSTIAVDAVPTDPSGDRRSRPGAGQRLDHHRKRQQRARGPGRRAARAGRAAATPSRRSAPAARTSSCR